MDITSYYRNILSTSYMVRVEFGGGETRYAQSESGIDSLHTPKLPEETIVKVLNGISSKEVRNAIEKEGSIDLLLVPRTLQGAGQSKSPSREALIAIPATSDLKGNLTYPKDKVPWIPRPLLREGNGSSMRNKLEVSVGTYEDFVNYVNSNEHAAELLNHIKTMDASDVKTRHEQWAKYIEYCMGLYDRVVKPDAGALGAAGLEINEDTLYVLYDTSVNASFNIEMLYGSIPQQRRTDSSKLALYDSLTRQTQREQSYAGLELDGVEQYLAHAGSASREYPMAASQRLAIHRFGMLRTGEILAVSGPPGTGKTTLLQSIVADLIVSHALYGRHLPPLIVATSTNNQAVTNVIDAFAKEVKQDEGLSVFRRWIPDVVLPGKEAANASANEEEGEVAAPLRGLGVYSPSSMKAQTASEKGYLTDDKKRKGNASLYNLTYARDYRAKARQLLSLEASAYFGKGLKCEGEKDAAKIRKKILKRLEEVDDLRRELIKQAKQGTPASTRKAEEIISKLTGYGAVDAKDRPIPAESIGNLAKLDAALDTTVRPLEFWLAIHFYEAYWLSIEQPSEQTLKKLGSYDANLSQYQLLSMIAPLNVMTLFRVPSQFKFGDKFYFGGIDLLIVDEAGQVDTPVGAAAFALAKRAVVVGDVHQLAPVWGLDPEGDSQIARTYMDMGERGNFREVWLRLKGLGLTASENSSLMAAAQSACPWTFANPDEDDSEELDELDMILKANFADLEEAKEPSPTGGIFLSEHRRCADNIIGYCNDLLYEGRLEPLRGSEQSAPIGLPTMGYCPVEGRSTTSGTSRKNSKEAEAIARWITAMLPSLWDAYNQAAKEKAQAAGQEPSEVDPRKVVGVVTPFASQAREVRAKLRWCGQNGRLTVGTTEVNLAKDITVGTAHSLQGAECPIVLFSLTYGERDTPTFVNGNPNLMNVAVSRAKDAFIVFGNEKTFSRETGNSVLGRLRERCFSHRVSMPEQTETTRPPIDRSGRAAVNADGNPAPAGAAPQGALSLTRAITEAKRRGAWPESLGTSVQQLNTALVEAGLLRLETDGGRHYVPTEAGASLGIATQVGKDGGSWPVYTPDALDRVAEALVRRATAGTARAASEKPAPAPAPAGAAPQGALSLTRAIKEARAREAWPESLGTSVRQLNNDLADAGLLRHGTDGEGRYAPTEAGASLGIATQVGKDGGSWPVYTPDALDRVAEALVSLNANRRRQE